MRFSQPLLVITGAAGMIGSGVVRHLNDLGYQNLLLVDDLKKGNKWKNLVGKRFVDLISRHQIVHWLSTKDPREVDAILHLGACSDTTEADADFLLENNFHFTTRLAEWALTHEKRFIYASSAATYGDGSQGFSDVEEHLQEFRPLNVYGFSKHLVDLWMQQHKVFDRVVGLKYFNIFGPNEYHKGAMSSMIFKMADKARAEGVVRLYKSNELLRFAHGEQKRDFLYLKDAVRMTTLFLEPQHRHITGIFNIGSGVPTTWNQMAEALFRALRLPVNIDYIEMSPQLSLQYQNYTCADMGKFRTMLSSSSPPTPMVDAVEEYVHRYLRVQSRW